MPRRFHRRFGLFRDPRRPWLDWGLRQSEPQEAEQAEAGRRRANAPFQVQRYLRPSPASIENVLRVRPDESLLLHASPGPLSARQATIDSRWHWVTLTAAAILAGSQPAGSASQVAAMTIALLLGITLAARLLTAHGAAADLAVVVEAHGHGLVVRDEQGHAEALPWTLVHSAWQASGEVILRLAPVQRTTPRYLHLPDTDDARRLLRAVELTQTWEAEGVTLPDLHEEVPDAALSPVRLDGSSPDAERGLSVSDGDKPVGE